MFALEFKKFSSHNHCYSNRECTGPLKCKSMHLMLLVLEVHLSSKYQKCFVSSSLPCFVCVVDNVKYENLDYGNLKYASMFVRELTLVDLRFN